MARVVQKFGGSSVNDSEAQNFGRDTHLGHDERYDRADEFLEAVTALWDSWEDGALVMDRASGEFADPDKVHEIEIIDSATYPLALVPADFQWSDIGNWLALYMLLSNIAGDDMVSSDATRHVDVNSKRLMVSNPDGRLVATAGLEDIIVVSTEDAVLVMHMSQLETVPETMRELLTKLTEQGKETYL